MGIMLGRFLTDAERDAMGHASVDRGGYRNGVAAGFVPGTGWFTPWVFTPDGNTGRRMMISDAAAPNASFLSPHYWRDWSAKRPPICIVGPNGEEWEIDRKASNGDGWTVTGEWPNITCSPSIVLRGYHGFLQGGQFTDDVEGRGPNGTTP
jgi:hypothetical protein